MNNTLLKLSLALGSFGAMTALAQTSDDWTIIQDFESDYAGFDLTLSASSGALELYTDPLDAGNQVFYVESGGYGIDNYATTYAVAELPTPVADGSTVTVYFRYYQVDVGNNFHVSLSDVANTVDTPRQWGDMETVFVVYQGDAKVRDQGRYPLIGTGDSDLTFVPFVPTNGTWYEFWMVCHNVSGSFDDVYSIYVRGGEFTTQTQLKIQELSQADGSLTGAYLDEGYFRNGTTDSLVSLIVATESGPSTTPFAGDPWYIDDIAVSDGANLTDLPASTGGLTWGGYPVVVGNDTPPTLYAITDEFIGTLALTDSDWCYSYRLKKWIWIPEPAPGAGAWLYLRN